MKKTILIIVMIVIISILYLFTKSNPKQVTEKCRNLAKEHYKQGLIAGPDAIGNDMENCLAKHGLNSSI